MNHIYRMMFLPGLGAVVLSLAGCGSADDPSLSAYGDEQLVELYSGGTKVREWRTTGKVISDDKVNGFSFKDAESGLLVRVTGNVVVTPFIQDAKSSSQTKPNTSVYDGIPPNVDAAKAINSEQDPFPELEKDKTL